MTATIPIVLERDNVNDESVTLVRWYIQNGERVDQDTLIAEVETSKANVEVHAPASGYLVQSFPAGAEIPVSAAIGQITAQAPVADTAPQPVATVAASAQTPLPGVVTTATSAPSAKVRTQSAWQDPQFPSNGAKLRISPVAARMMEASGIPASAFSGFTVVRKQDVLDYLNPPAAAPAPAVNARACPAPSKINQPYTEVPLSKMKRSEGANLAAGVANAVSSAITVACYTRGLRELIAARMDGGNASAVIVYEVSRLLRKYPTLNAAYRNGVMLQYEQVNVGFAMDDGRGLKVAVLSNCDTLTLHQVTEKLRDLTVAYLDDKLGVAQVSNATFTISDLSGMGVFSFLPLISENQSGILGIGGEQFAPGSNYGCFNMTLAFDHQLSDGRIASLFLNDLKDRLQSYEHTLMEDEAQKKPQKELCCSQCFRSLSTLRSTNKHLFVSAEPEGYVCTFCAEGY